MFSPHQMMRLYQKRGASGKSPVFVCLAIPGRQFAAQQARNQGKPCKAGYDSHYSPCGQELVFFQSDQLLPCFIVDSANMGEANRAVDDAVKKIASTTGNSKPLGPATPALQRTPPGMLAGPAMYAAAGLPAKPPSFPGSGQKLGGGEFPSKMKHKLGANSGAQPADPTRGAKAPEVKRSNWRDKLSSSMEQQKQKKKGSAPASVAVAPKRKPGSSWRYRAQHNEAKKMRREKEAELNQELAGECEMCMLDDGEHEGWCEAAKKTAGVPTGDT